MPGPDDGLRLPCNLHVPKRTGLESCADPPAILEADVRIERSLLGREVILRRCSGRPKTQKFILGDQSIVELC